MSIEDKSYWIGGRPGKPLLNKERESCLECIQLRIERDKLQNRVYDLEIQLEAIKMILNMKDLDPDIANKISENLWNAL